MKLISFLFFQLIAFSAGASSIDLLPLQSQFRYEDTAVQSKELVSYQGFALAYQLESSRIGIALSRSHQDKTGNSSFSIEAKKSEFLVSGGYQIFHIEGAEQKLTLDIYGQGVLGVTQSEVTTNLLGSTTSNKSEQTLVGGAGASVVGRWKFLFTGIDFQVLTSSAFSPQFISAATFNFIGFQIPLN